MAPILQSPTTKPKPKFDEVLKLKDPTQRSGRESTMVKMSTPKILLGLKIEQLIYNQCTMDHQKLDM